MLIPFQDALKPYQNLKLQHRGLVVRNDDPLNLGRVKCKIQGLIESSDIERLPWCYPKESTSRGGRSDSGSTAVPPLNSMVLIEFPAGGDSPVGGGNPYYPVWVGMPRMDISNPGVGTSTTAPEDDQLSTPYSPGNGGAQDLESNVWLKSTSGNVAWVRIDKNRGSVEFFDQDAGTTIRIDRGGNVQLKITSLDVVASGDARFKVGGDFHVHAGGNVFLHAESSVGVESGADTAISSKANVGVEASSAVGIKSGTTLGLTAGSDLGGKAGSNLAFQSGGSTSVQSGSSVGVQASSDIGLSASASIGLSASASIGLSASASISEQASVCTRDAGMISDNGGGGGKSVDAYMSTPPEPLPTVSAVMSNMSDASGKVDGHANALGNVASALMQEAQKVKQAGQAVIEKVKNWANAITGANI